MRDALVLAQKAADETRAAARAQADARIQEAQARCQELDARMQARLAEMTSQIERLRQERRRLARDLRAQLAAHLDWLTQEIEADRTEEGALPELPGPTEPRSLGGVSGRLSLSAGEPGVPVGETTQENA